MWAAAPGTWCSCSQVLMGDGFAVSSREPSLEGLGVWARDSSASSLPLLHVCSHSLGTEQGRLEPGGQQAYEWVRDGRFFLTFSSASRWSRTEASCKGELYGKTG